MNFLEKLGKKRTILISISILLVSINTIFDYYTVIQKFDIIKFSQQIIRFALTILLLKLVYDGKNWARIVSIVLFSLAIIVALAAMVTLSKPLIYKIPFIVMIFVYSVAVYYFAFSESFKAFSNYQNNKEN